MRRLPTLRQELTASFAAVFAGAFVVAVAGAILVVPRFESVGPVVLYLGVLLLADIAVIAYFGRYLIRRRLLAALDELVEGVESIEAGDYARRLPEGDTSEISRVTSAVNRMAERLIAHREQLAANVRSLEETNRQLTEARDELIRSEKAATVGRLAAGIAHEVGNPLSAVIGYIGILKRHASEEDRELLAAAEREAHRIDRIVRGLLDYARPRDARVHPIDVAAVVERTLELLSTQGRFQTVAVEREFEPVAPPVDADPHQLEQVLVNLLLNATDALEGREGARLVVSTRRRVLPPERPQRARRRDDPPDVDYSHRRRFHERPRVPRENPFPEGGEVVEITVRDNGPGIPGELVSQLFEPFVTTKEPGKGTGLGLAVSARLIDAMGGTIAVENDDAGGARFTIVLPVARPAMTAMDEAGASPDAVPASARPSSGGGPIEAGGDP